MAVVLCDFRWLWVREFLNESGADARRLVERFTTLWTAVTGDLDFLIWIGSVAPFRVVTGLSARRATVSTWLFVVLVPTGRGRLLLVRLVLARWCVRPFVPSQPASEALVLFTELLILFTELLILFTELFDLFLKRSKACEDFLFGSVGRSHEQARRDGLRTGDHPSKVHSFACCNHIRHQSGGSYERLSKSTWG
jgi:hypothetical protein